MDREERYRGDDQKREDGDRSCRQDADYLQLITIFISFPNPLKTAWQMDRGQRIGLHVDLRYLCSISEKTSLSSRKRRTT